MTENLKPEPSLHSTPSFNEPRNTRYNFRKSHLPFLFKSKVTPINSSLPVHLKPKHILKKTNLKESPPGNQIDSIFTPQKNQRTSASMAKQ